MNQEIKYWKQRCEAAEKILQRQPPTNRMQFIPKSIYDEWQSLVNTPPSPEPVIREIGITQDAKPIMSASEFMLETHGNDYLQDGMYLDGRDILGFMEEYAKQFTPDPPVKESVTTDSVSAEIAHTEIDWPTDEEINDETESRQLEYADEEFAFINGAKWMRDHIKSKMK